MKKHIQAFCLAVLTAFIILLPVATEAAEQTVPILSIDGSGKSTASPDQAFISLGVITQAPEAQDAQSQNSAIANAIQASLSEIGIPEKCIQTRNYSFQILYSHERGHQDEITGYTVNNTVTVEVNDVSLVGKVIDAALSNGANRVSSLTFNIRDTKQLRKEALSNAIKDAREKADIIASGLGKSIVGVQNVSESSGNIQPRVYGNMMLARSAAMDTTPIEAGTIDLSASVHIDFILSN